MISEPERFAASTIDHTERKAGDQPVAAREVLRTGLPSERHLRDCGTFGQNRVEQVDVLLGIDVIVTAGENRDGAGRKARAMRDGIDAARKARSDHETGFGKLVREALGEFQSGSRRIAEPTIAIIGRVSAARLPRTARSGGASSISASRCG